MKSRLASEVQSTPIPQNIYSHDSIKTILKHCQYNTFAVFDLDNTLVEATEDLGSDQWFEKLMFEAKKISPGDEARDLVVAIYNAVQHHITLQAVENDTVPLISILQDLNIPVLALTARGEVVAKPTIQNLQAVGIHFDKQWKQGEHVLGYIDQSKILFKDGIIFCSGKKKGQCLSLFFDAIEGKPEHVLMVDDKESHLITVKEAIDGYQAKFTGVRYGFLDDKIKKVDMELADKQMGDMAHKFPETVKQAIAKVRPEGFNMSLTSQTQAPLPAVVNSTIESPVQTNILKNHPFFGKNKSLPRQNSCPNPVRLTL